MKTARMKWLVLLGFMLCALVVGAVAAAADQTPRYRLGEPIVFMIEDQKAFGWGCCCTACADTQILGWRIADLSGVTVYSLRFDPPGYASDWDGTWYQSDDSGVSVPAGLYTLYVDTTAGALSRCFSLYDPCCGSCWYRCSVRSSCNCGQVATITYGGCRTSLVLRQEEKTCCSFQLFRPCCP